MLRTIVLNDITQLAWVWPLLQLMRIEDKATLVSGNTSGQARIVVCLNQDQCEDLTRLVAGRGVEICLPQ